MVVTLTCLSLSKRYLPKVISDISFSILVLFYLILLTENLLAVKKRYRVLCILYLFFFVFQEYVSELVLQRTGELALEGNKTVYTGERIGRNARSQRPWDRNPMLLYILVDGTVTRL